uniref:NADH-ubiquinone oxidoreductase chain 3 n=1 Tax=Kiwa tyleri TaxID=1676998 RepID=A0A343CXB6_KIWTY|nr:NADH dehydrogenase subunit 3 [Kiwa tyleri]ARQ27011.1 NADH dehydrogenase subunit 3 [Kiwa tyleri]
MFLLTSLSLLTLIITILIMFIASFLSKKMLLNREKMSSYECGFDPKSSARFPFSLRFFLIAVIFLIFDVEIALIFPLAFIIQFSNIFSWLFTGSLFIIILLFGLYYEWSQGALEWKE